MSNIQVGDMVTWQETALARRPYLHTKTGVVTEIDDLYGYAEVKPNHMSYSYRIPLDKLTRVGPIEAVTDDYDMAVRQAGNLGGVELS